MLLIECPYCGPRNETEYTYGGQAHVAYPENPDELSDHEWAEFLFYRANPLGRFAERWMHGVGCRRWFNAIRDTGTYKVLATYPMGTTPPEIPTSTTAAAIGGKS
ncbi:sarcosine oxidase subunit delta [Arthrobacter monumenti]